MTRMCAIIAALALFAAAADAAEIGPAKPGLKDRCPVCGMYPVKYPVFVAQVLLKGGSRAFFDGTKDMLKYYHRTGTYSPGRTSADIDAVFVTDYYSVKPIDGRNAFFVKDSDVSGPMGKDLMPFKSRRDAEKFMRDHRGRRILTFGEITADVMKELE